MRRTAHQYIRDLEIRLARLERQADIYTPENIKDEYDDADRLSNVDPVLAKHLVVDGDPSKDKISISQTMGDVTQLKPSQTTMDLEKAVFFSFLVLNGSFTTDMGAIVSPEGNILDGHHRWAAWTIAKGHQKPKVEYWLARLPGPQLIRVLNVVTKGYLNNLKGNKGTGNIKDFTPKKVQAQLEVAVKSGIRSFNAQQCVALLEKNFGSIEAGIEQMAKNTGLMELRTPNWAPARIDMPKIDEEDISDVADLLGKGKVEWKPPYHEIKTSSRERSIVRRMMRRRNYDY